MPFQKSDILQSRWLVPLICVLVFASAIGGLLWVTREVGKNLAPVKPKVIIFGAAWCRWCPKDDELSQLAAQNPDVDIIHVDVDKEPGSWKEYGFDRIPAIFVEKDGKRTSFGTDMSKLQKWLAKFKADLEDQRAQEKLNKPFSPWEWITFHLSC